MTFFREALERISERPVLGLLNIESNLCSLSDVQKIVGYGKGKEEIYRHLRDYELPHGQLSRFH